VRYIPNTSEVREEMLAELGFESLDALFATIPEEMKLGRPLDLPPPMSEKALLDYLGELGRRNASAESHACFLGGGSYSHFIPAIVPALVSRGEFLTAYTPYQPEVSQGTLQAMYEFQSFACLLTGMEVSNASMYDGASAVAEAVLMARRITGRERYLVAESLHPEYREVLRSYTAYLGVELVGVPFHEESGRIDGESLRELVDDRTGGLVLQSPNFFGVVEDTAPLAATIHEAGGLLVSSFNEPFSLGLLKSPGEQGADIAAGEAMAFGSPVSFGGPALGLLATKQEHTRNMPGRIVGRTEDTEGKSGFVLTLSTREQHIRRERATSNICSNEGLCALAATVFLSALGRRGLRAAAEQNLSKARWLRERILALPGYSPLFNGPFFNEFAVRGPESPGRLRRRLAAAGILGGLHVGEWYPSLKGGLLFCVTENNTPAEMERLLKALEGRK
jgi:glycine dehydrogenase subunit 1